MVIKQSLQQKQVLALSQIMLRSLDILQLPAEGLREYIQEAAVSNPLIHVDETSADRNAFVRVQSGVEMRPAVKYTESRYAGREEEFMELDVSSIIRREKSFSEYLLEQLGEMKQCDDRMYMCCRYIIGCLDSRGYLDCDARELSAESGLSLFEVEQAILAVQTLDPAGVGARSLSECLMLQLMRGRHFNETNIHVIRHGLELVAQRDIGALAELLGISTAEAEESVKVIQSMNPIPSAGFNTGSAAAYVIPEAYIYTEHGDVIIEMNNSYLPRVGIDENYSSMIGDGRFPEAQGYLKEKQNEAKELLSALEKRQNTMIRLLDEMVRRQESFFLGRGELLPMTMQQMAERLSLGVSTVSRAIKDKYILINGKAYPLRAMFNTAAGSDGRTVTALSVQARIKQLIQLEDAAEPLSDEDICDALKAMGIKISRRTVYNYRNQLGIPGAKQRRVK